MNLEELIRVGNFTTIKGDGLAENGLPADSLVYVAGSRTLPVDEADPYLQRVYFIVCPTEDEEVDTGRFILVQGTSLDKVPEDEQERLDKLFKEKFDEAG